MYDSLNKKVNIFYDAEFTGLHRNTTLISIGMVTEYGSTFYAEFTDYDRTQVDSWIKNNVIDNMRFNGSDVQSVEIGPSMPAGEHMHREMFNPFTRTRTVQLHGPKDMIKTELLKWLKDVSDITDKRQIQIVSDCYTYDWMLLNDLICEGGQARNIPEFISYIPIDLSAMLFMQNVDPDINREEFCADQDLGAFKILGESGKHNSLWDAYIIRACYSKLVAGANVFTD